MKKNRQKAPWLSLEQITSISVPQTGRNLPDREPRRTDGAIQVVEEEREEGCPARPLQFSGGQQNAARAPANYKPTRLFMSARRISVWKLGCLGLNAALCVISLLNIVT